MIIAENLSKTFKRRISKKNKKFETVRAVDNLNLHIKKGEIYGLIGPNGAGKTTTLKIFSTLILPDSGTVTIDGYDVIKDPIQIKHNVGLLAGEFTRSLYWRLSGKQNLRFFAKLRGIWKPDDRIAELIELFKLQDYADELVMKYSTGNKHKLALALGMLEDQKVLFLDEPLTGIDPITAYDIKNLIKNQFKDKTMIWASHNLFEIEVMCDRIGMINKGKIVFEGDPKSLKQNYWDHKKIQVFVDKPNLFEGFLEAYISGKVVEIKTKNVNKTMFEIMKHIKDNQLKILDIKIVEPTLEDIFMGKVKND